MNIFASKRTMLNAFTDRVNPGIIHFQKSEGSFLVSLINVFSHIGIFPFRMVYSAEKEEFISVTSNFRKITCFCLHCCLTVAVICWTYPIITLFLGTKATVIFFYIVGLQITTTLGLFIILKIAWLNEPELVKFCNLTSHPFSQQKSKFDRANKYLIISVGLLVVVLHAISGVFAPGRQGSTSYCFGFVRSKLAPLFSFLGADPITWIKHVIGDDVAHQLGLVVFSILCSYSIMPIPTFLAVALHMYSYVGNELHLIDTSEKPGALEVMKIYKRVVKHSNMLSNILSGFIVNYYVMSLLVFATIPTFLLSPPSDICSQLYLYTQTVLVSVSIYIAMKTNVQMDKTIGKFILKRHIALEGKYGIGLGNLTKEHLLLVALRLSYETSQVGVACNFFTFTKTFVRATISVVATYAVVMLQISEKEFMATNPH